MLTGDVGFAVGDSGTILKTTALKGDTVIVTGADATAARSYDDGISWTTMSFHIESQSDVNKSIILSSGEVMFCGGGGFIRKTADGGRSFTFQKNPMLANLHNMYFYDNQRGWGCSERTDAIIRTTNGGATWLLPAGTTVNYSWSQKLSTSQTVLGNTFTINAFDKKTIYVVLGTRVYISRDIGETWTQIATILSGTKTNSFYVSPLDINLFVAAFGATDVSGGTGIRTCLFMCQTEMPCLWQAGLTDLIEIQTVPTIDILAADSYILLRICSHPPLLA